MSVFGAIGDPHGDTSSIAAVMRRHRDVGFWLCVGDLGGDEGLYANPPAPLYWIKGNNEDFDVLAGMPDARFPDLHYIPNGTAAHVGALKVAGLGGTFAPTWYETPAAALPFPARVPGAHRTTTTIARDKRRHFVAEEVDACKRLSGVDVLLTHEAPKPFFVRFSRPGGHGSGMDAGKPQVNEVLAAMKPRLHLFGHHHRFEERERDGVRSICLDEVSVAYLIFDETTLEYERIVREAA